MTTIKTSIALLGKLHLLPVSSTLAERDHPAGVTQTSSPLSWWLLCLIPGAMIALTQGIARCGTAMPHVVAVATTCVMAGVQLVMLPFLGGFTYRAEATGLTVGLGLLQIPIKRLGWSSIERVEVLSDVRPLVDFGGYGLRRNASSRKTGYIVSSGGAVQVTSEGWAYVMVMPDPKSFAAVIERRRERQQHHAST
jgi:hypothetical protein